MTIYQCEVCGEECKVIEEVFNYSGTHCTHGKPSIHHTGRYVSKCCLSDYTEEE